MLNEVAVHMGAFVQHQAVQDGIVAVHMRLQHAALRRVNVNATRRFRAFVAPVGIGVSKLVGEQILDHWFVVKARGEAEQRAAKVE